MKTLVIVLITIICFILIAISFYSNESLIDQKLTETLVFAGSNRSQLEKVLNYYENDSLKLLAAKYLISNMKNKFSYKDSKFDSIMRLKIKLYNNIKLSEEEIRYGMSLELIKADKVYDAKVITSDYLISNIEFAFWNWRNRPWNKNLSFEMFCSLLLPYRIADEPLSNWQCLYKNKYSPILDSIYKGEDMILAAKAISDTIKSVEKWSDYFSSSHHDATFLFNYPIGECSQLCEHVLYVLRALGIPTAIDMYPYSPERRYAHHWNVIKEPNGEITSFWISESDIIRHRHENRKKGKVYRLTYENEQSNVMINNSKELYPFFIDENLKDVTEEYFGHNNATILIPNELKSRLAYLCVFSLFGWQPIAVTEIMNHRAVFNNIEPNLIYFPFVFENSKFISTSQPFIFDGKYCHYFNFETGVTENVILYRKYPFDIYRHQIYMDNVVGALILGSNEKLLVKKNILANIVDTPKLAYNYCMPTLSEEFKYILYKPQKVKNVILADIFFYTNDKKLYPRLYFKNDTDNIDINSLNNICDEDPLTSICTNKIGAEIVFEFDKPYKISKIEYTPKNDDNFIRTGDEYELFIYESKFGWISIGKKVANKEYVEFENVPKGGLLLLHDWTRGNEEQIFYMKDGKQMFP